MRFTPKSFKPSFQRRTVVGFALLSCLLAVACASATVTPAPMLVRTHTPTPTPLPTAESTPVAVDLDKAATDAHAELQMILEELGPRESATTQESEAASYLEGKFLSLGYATEIQTFPVIGQELAGMGLTLTTPLSREFVALPMTKSGLGDVSGILTPVGLGMPGDMPEDGLQGRVALAIRGVIPFQSKAENVFAAGAVGLVVYNNVPGIFQGALAGESEFPVISISDVDGEAITELLADSDSEAQAKASITLTLEERPSQNVIAEKQGAGEFVVVLGGHYDSIPGVSGANDNASGTAVLLTIAQMLADIDLPFTLRIIPFGSEELGLLGSRFYVDSLTEQELANTKAMLNFDALGTGSGVSIFGAPDLTEMMAGAGKEIGIDIAVTRGLSGGTSDYASFENVGVPHLMFFGDDPTRIHSELDTLEFVQPEMLGGAVASTLALLQSPEFADFVNLN